MKNKKNTIIFISSNYPPRIGGPASLVPQLSRKLSEKFNMVVIAFREKGFPNYEKGKFELFRSPSFYKFGFSNPLSVAIRTILLSFYSRKILSKKKAKIIHSHDVHISLVAALFCKITSFRKVCVITKYAGDSVLEFSGLSSMKDYSIEKIIKNPGVKKKVLMLVQRQMFKMCDYVHAHNNYQKKILKKLYNVPEKKILSLSNPIDTKKFNYKKKSKKRKGNKKEINFLIASRLVPWKCPELVIKSFKEMSKKNSKIRLTIVGDGEEKYKSKLKNLAKDSEGKIKFVGRIENEKMSAYYCKSNVLIQASSYEPFSNTILESLSCGTPVIASDTGGNAMLVEEGRNGYLFKVNNQKDFEKKFKKIILKLKKFKAKEVSKSVKKYELEKVSGDFANAYNKIIKIKNL